MANGMSTLFIAQAVKDNGGGTHTSIDPFQPSQWGNTARKSIERAGLQDMVGTAAAAVSVLAHAV
mgnify:FL=1